MYGFKDNNATSFLFIQIVYKCIWHPILHIISFPPHYHIDISGRNLQERIQGGHEGLKTLLHHIRNPKNGFETLTLLQLKWTKC